MIELIQIPAVLWFVVGLLLLLAELAMPGLIIIFFGVGAWVTALACLLIDLSFNSQLVVFMLASVICLVALRRFLVKNNLTATLTSLNSNELNKEFIGHTCMVSETILPGTVGGRVSFRGTNWKALSDVSVTAGETVRIIAKDSIVLIVEPLT